MSRDARISQPRNEVPQRLKPGLMSGLYAGLKARTTRSVYANCETARPALGSAGATAGRLLKSPFSGRFERAQL